MAFQEKTIDNLCRLCAIESQSGTIIYSKEGENLCLEDKIINCLRIEISSDDMLPKKVCHLCTELLEDFYRFSKRAAQVQQTLGLLSRLDVPYIHSKVDEICLMQANVKMESNFIKNELDESMVQQFSIQSESNKFEFPLEVQSQIDYQSEEERKKLILEDFNDRELLIDKDNINNAEVHLNDIGYIESVRHLHRRKMTQPKKAASEGIIVPSKMEDQQCLMKMQIVDCIVSDSNGNQTNFKSEDFNESDLLQDLGNEDNKQNNVIINDEEDEGDSEIEKEWHKTWGIMCDQCTNNFPTKVLFDEHYWICHNKKPSYTCSYCKKCFQNYSGYRSHSFRHMCEDELNCKFCEKKFFIKEMLEVHMMTHNEHDKPFICEECGLGFPTQQKLVVHQKKHKAQTRKQFQCTECGKVLQTKGGLTAHLTVHKLGRRFMCHLCGKTFTQKINMQQHVRHHKGERPYSCENCGKSFTEKSHLNRHKSFHSLDRPYQCPICKKMYKTERCLKVHSHVHLNTRPYVCSYCGKGFLSSTKLKQHCNCHTGERPFACKYCERTFTNYPNWLKHTRRRHKVDHKTGLSLKEESEIFPEFSENGSMSATVLANDDNGCTKLGNAKVRNNDSGSGQQANNSLRSEGQLITDLVPQTLISEFNDAQNAVSEYHMHSVAANTQSIYLDCVTPCFRINFKEIAQTEI